MTLAQPVEPVRTIVALRSSARRLTPSALLAIALPGVIVWLTGLSSELWQTLLVLSAGIAVFVIGCVLPLLAWLAKRVTVTNRHIATQSGLITRELTEVTHAMGYTVMVRQSPMQRLLRTGDVHLRIPGNEQPHVLRDIPHPELLQTLLGDLVAEAAQSATARIAPHGAHTTDATRRFDPRQFGSAGVDADTQRL